MSAVTLALGVVAVGVLVYAVGVEESREAAARAGNGAKRAGSGAKRAASSGFAAGVAGAGLGLQFGDQLVNAILAEPGFALTAVAGFMGALGIEGVLGDISGIQFLLIGFVVFLTGYALFGGDD